MHVSAQKVKALGSYEQPQMRQFQIALETGTAVVPDVQRVTFRVLMLKIIYVTFRENSKIESSH